MNVYEIRTAEQLIKGNPYVGRGIIAGKTPDGKKAAVAYFIMGRSANSRNRVFVEKNGELFTEPYDAAKAGDPSLIIYAAIREYENNLIVTNGDQTDTIYEGLKNGVDFAAALQSRCFEPDAPNFTPRISAVLSFGDNDFKYRMSILKSIDPEGSGCARFTFDYPSVAGLGHFIHTYVTDGSPLPTFTGEPERTAIRDDIDEMTSEIWDSLDADNRISLYVRYTDIETGEKEERIINGNGAER
ncbi:MAG: IMP cyclohydrolase [Clostridia bacterium]|nr:IMP cyclohydrolase [Clostridia bacterium]